MNKLVQTWRLRFLRGTLLSADVRAALDELTEAQQNQEPVQGELKDSQECLDIAFAEFKEANRNLEDAGKRITETNRKAHDAHDRIRTHGDRRRRATKEFETVEEEPQ